jgi:hypothetical protein
MLLLQLHLWLCALFRLHLCGHLRPHGVGQQTRLFAEHTA